MSRSVKKTAGYCDRNPFMKNYANRKIRRIPIEIEEDWVDPIPYKGNGYRRNMCSYDICDFKWHYFGGFEEFYQRELRLATELAYWRLRYRSHVVDEFPTRENCWKHFVYRYKTK